VTRRIDQVIPVLRGRNAVGTHTLNVQAALRSVGVESEIFYEEVDAGLEARGQPLTALFEPAPERTVLFQAAIGSPAFEVMARIKDELFINYHNITPSELIEPWEPEIAAVGLHRGRAQLAGLVRRCDRALAVSRYSERELIDLGFRRTGVAPLLLDMSPGDDVDETLLDALRSRRAQRGPSLLFVGQLAPHKAPHHLVAMLAALRALYSPDATLTLVGQPLGEAYPRALQAYVDSLGLGDAVVMVGGLELPQLEAHWRSADVFVCASEHEGFCAPLVEAMGHGVPVVAFASSAVPETIGDAGLVLERKDPVGFATAVHRVSADEALRSQLITKGLSRAASFDLAAATPRFLEALLSP
jgi:glycosyltransferase involved in cell wall biosynthesis